MRLSRILTRIRALTPEERRLVVEAWLLLLVVDWGLRNLPLRRMQALLAVPPRPAAGAEPEQAHIRRVESCVDMAIRHHLYPMTCLRRALALQRLLAGQGLETTLRLGVRKNGELLQAHAWLERAGQPIGEKEDQTLLYSPFSAANWERVR